MKTGRFIGLAIFVLSPNLPVAASVVADGGDTTLVQHASPRTARRARSAT
jgi:hypothetical protein